MSGPIKKPKIGFGIGWLEFLTAIAGLIVVLGLWKESWSEWAQALRNCSWPFDDCHWPSNNVQGSLLVAIGVFAEVTIGIFIARSSKREQIESATRIAELGERAAKAEQSAAETLERATKAEQSAAEANLARAKLEQRMKPRLVLGPESETFKEFLIPHAGKHLDIMIFDQHLQETTALAWQFLSLFRSAGWHVRMYEPIGAQHRIPGAPLVIATGIDAPIAMVELAVALFDRFKELDIECHVAPSSYGEVGKPRAFDGSFRVVKEEPLRIFGGKPVAPFRIQIGALQLVPVPPARIFIGRTAQKPPQV
jgi:hypothetical protein